MRRRAELLYPKLLFSCADFPGNTGQIARAEQGGRSCFAKRMECVELAPAFEPRHTSDSGSKLHALHTLRETRPPLSPSVQFAPYPPKICAKKQDFRLYYSARRAMISKIRRRAEDRRALPAAVTEALRGTIRAIRE